jgi:AcrR family transcriptional regulator
VRCQLSAPTTNRRAHHGRYRLGVARQSTSRRGTLNEQRWLEILNAAAEEFYENGYKSARLQDIGRRVGLLTGSLYYYIDSKEDLLFALVEAAHEKGLAIIAEDETSAAGDAPTRLRNFIVQHTSLQLESRADVVAVVERDRLHLSSEHRSQVDAMRRKIQRHVVGIIDQGKAEGAFDPAIDSTIAANSLFATLNGTSDWIRDFRRFPEVTDFYVRLFLNGLAGDSARPAPVDARPIAGSVVTR